jgi:hypothetical protein
MTILILIKITNSKKEAMLIATRHLKQVDPHMSPMEVLTTLSVDFNLSKKQALSFQTKGVESSPPR